MSGYLGSLSDRQQAALDQFRNVVEDVRRATDTDAFLLRWLRARDFDVTKAEKMYRHHLEWRKENGVDDMLHSYEIPELVKENFPGAFLHPGKDGRPVWIFPVGLDVHALLQALTPTVMRRHTVYLTEQAEYLKRDSSKKMGKEIHSHYFVADLDKLRLRQVYSWQEDGWKERLLEIVDAAILPAHWGGNMVGPDGDPMCRHKVNYGGRFEEGATSASYDSVFDEKDAQQQTIGRRDRWELAVDVAEAGARLSWRFQTATGDLAFGLRDRCGQALVPLQRLEACSLVPQEGAWHCDTPGTYVLEFDNTYSWLNDKTLAYIVNVDSPEQFP
ncbi:SEC14-like protein 2 isoform X3 [Dermacentor silvarum]|uniref:SEC14-like protein 2 isoform X3 n=1 Tax=Dermacentor silvarum TaxID=543639 RepID=UPI002101C7A8|nr:SEC14-like protein 2 isoform X3 [Dermacentor silvarum]